MKNVSALKHLGQHFLHCPRVLTKITQSVHEAQSDTAAQDLTEIGPGMGALTQYLRPLAQQYWVLEQDERFTEHLHAYDPKLHIVWGDALQYDWSACPFGVLVGNLPYNISVPLMLKWIQYIQRFPCAVFMMQKEVGKRVIAAPCSKAYGRLSVMLQSFAHVKWIMDVGPGAFSPPPKVDSCVLRFTKRADLPVYFKVLERLVKVSFSQRRKMLRNTLSQYSGQISWQQWSQWLDQVGIQETARAEEVTVSQYIHLSTIMGAFHGMESN